jgi:transposase
VPLGELSRLDREIAAMDRRIEQTVRKTGTSLTSIRASVRSSPPRSSGRWATPPEFGPSPPSPCCPARLRSLASSGQVQRHRLNRGGNRQLNWALHYIALVQCRISPDAQAYMDRQREASKFHKEAMRCLKRHLSNVVYRHLVVDARRAEPAA